MIKLICSAGVTVTIPTYKGFGTLEEFGVLFSKMQNTQISHLAKL